MVLQRRRLTEEETHPADEQQVTQDTSNQTALYDLKLAFDQSDDRYYGIIPINAVRQKRLSSGHVRRY
jgi:hypothetical protein